MSYWLGLLFADGNVGQIRQKSKRSYRVQLSLKCSDHHHIIRFKEALHSTYCTSLFKNGPSGYCRSLHVICNDELALDLISLGCVPRKSLTLDWPDTLPAQYANHFVRGYFDGDGSICYDSKRCDHSIQIAGSKTFIPKLQSYIKENVLQSCKFNGSVGELSSGSCSRLQYGGNATPLKVLDWMYMESAEATRLDRKYMQYQKWTDISYLKRKHKRGEMRQFLESESWKDCALCKQSHLCPRVDA